MTMEQTRQAVTVNQSLHRGKTERIRRRDGQSEKRRPFRAVRLAALFLSACLLIYLGRDFAEGLYYAGRSNLQVFGATFGKTQLSKEVEEELLALASGDSVIARIYQDRTSYPPELLKALTLNQELLDFVVGYPDSDGSVTGGFTAEETGADYPLLMQWDSRWGYHPYGESNIGIAGCGPTCLSMVILALTKDEAATPDKLADYSMRHGHYVPGAGTAWSFMTKTPAAYGIASETLGLDEAAMKRRLDQGDLIICAMRPGDFTTTGHFIVIYGYDEDGFRVNDPNSRERSGRAWPFSRIQNQIKNIWAFSAS